MKRVRVTSNKKEKPQKGKSLLEGDNSSNLFYNVEFFQSKFEKEIDDAFCKTGIDKSKKKKPAYSIIDKINYLRANNIKF